jgi:hypothetical protein
VVASRFGDGGNTVFCQFPRLRGVLAGQKLGAVGTACSIAPVSFLSPLATTGGQGWLGGDAGPRASTLRVDDVRIMRDEGRVFPLLSTWCLLRCCSAAAASAVVRCLPPPHLLCPTADILWSVPH